MKNHNQKGKWSIIIIAVTVVMWIGLTGSASAQGFYPVVIHHPTSLTSVKTGDQLAIVWDDGAPEVNICLYIGGYFYDVIATDVSAGNGGSNVYYWTVPGYFLPRNNYQVRVIETSAFEENGGPIVPPGPSSDISEMFTIYCDCPADGGIGS